MSDRRVFQYLVCISLGMFLMVRVQSAEAQANDLESTAQTVTEWQAQMPRSIVLVTGVQIEVTESGLNIVLETDGGQLPVPKTRVVGNDLIADIPNAVLVKRFEQANPSQGIALIRVTNLPGKRVRVAIAGTDAPPTAQISPAPTGLAFRVTTEEEIEIVVTGEQEEDNYAVPNASVGTRTNTPLRDVPQSIQVVPRQVIEDQGITDLNDALRNVSGVSLQNELPLIRGFDSTDNVLSDGIRRTSSLRIFDLDVSNVEQIEVLKGPASVLYGSGEPGGTINITTEQPLREPRYEIEGTIGNFDFYRSAIDLTGPLNDGRTILYRLNVAYENAGSFVDFLNYEQWSIFPVLSFQLGENTNLTLEGAYQPRSGNTLDEGLPAVGTVLPNPLGEVPRSRNLAEPDNRVDFTNSYVGYLLNHEFSEDWSLRNRFRASFSDYEALEVFPGELAEDNRTVARTGQRANINNQTYTLQTDVLGQIKTGIVQHELLLGLELQRNIREDLFEFTEDVSSIDLFEPEYGSVFDLNNFEPSGDNLFTDDLIGVYAQNLMSIGDRVKILLGGRFDWAFNNTEDRLADSSDYSDDNAFSPRVGIVYQPIDPVSFYASWSRSFSPQFGADRQGNPFVPIEGEQFEIGAKTEFLDGRLIATLAAYQITRQNDFVPDPDNPDFEIQIGEQRSRGIEFDLSGEPLPGLRLIATYAYTDATITEDTRGFEGNRSSNIPEHSGSLWAVYEIQSGSLEGLGLGAGIFVVGEREGDLENSFELPAYARTDLLLYYRQENWRVQLNVENLFDGNYFRSSASRNNVFYGEPFTIRGTVSVEF
jgi:iron complex outermembrane recepter protein